MRGVHYCGLFLDGVERSKLLDWVGQLGGPPPGFQVYADHVTVHYKPDLDQLSRFPFGLVADLRVLGIANNDGAMAVHVEIPEWVPTPAAAVPHVTVAVAPGRAPQPALVIGRRCITECVCIVCWYNTMVYWYCVHDWYWYTMVLWLTLVDQ